MSDPRYRTSRWQRLRKAHLSANPLCTMCLPRVTAATVVDHVTPHRGDATLFWDSGNLQSLCTIHHNRTKQQVEVRGYSAEVGKDGWPTDPQHPANR